jgi:hypothetical protein
LFGVVLAPEVKKVGSRRASLDFPTSRKKGDKFIYRESPGTQASMSRHGGPAAIHAGLPTAQNRNEASRGAVRSFDLDVALLWLQICRPFPGAMPE